MPSLLEETRLLQCMEKPNDRRLLSQNSSVIVTRKERGGEEKKNESSFRRLSKEIPHIQKT